MLRCYTAVKHSAIKFTALLFFFGFINLLMAQSQHPSFEPLFIFNEKSPVYTADEVFELGLLLSECEKGSETWNRCNQKFKAIKKEVTSSAMKNLSDEEKGKAILKYLYEDYLKTYSSLQTKLDVAFETGSYNCVSSAVLYMVAAKAAGLDVRGQKTTQHAFCSIYVPGVKEGQLKKIDVETTNPYGFNPGSKEEVEFEDQIKAYYVVPKKYYSNRKEVNDGIFAGLIAGNLTSIYIKTGDYQKALPLGAARWEIVKSEPEKSVAFVRNDFDILAANYVNLLPYSVPEFLSKFEWFISFIERWGNTDFLQKNLDNSFVNLLIVSSQGRNYELTMDIYEKYKDKVSASQIAKVEEIIADTILFKATAGLSTEEKITEINSLISSEELAIPARRKRAELHLESYWLEHLNIFMNNRDYETGYESANLAASQLPKSSKIKTMQNGFYKNIIVTIHNQFVKEANARNFDAAQKILEEGLKKYPDNKSLKKDLMDLQKVMDNQ